MNTTNDILCLACREVEPLTRFELICSPSFIQIILLIWSPIIIIIAARLINKYRISKKVLLSEEI